jgi:membrane-bound lytic murein transglycosylase MltF
MDVLAEMRERHKVELGDWSWESPNLYDPNRQMRALILLNKSNYIRITGTADETEHLAMMFIAYNGGLGRVINDRKLCQAISGCDASQWFGQAEKQSALAKKALPGYGKSFFEINREYPRNIMYVRALKYRPLFS